MKVAAVSLGMFALLLLPACKPDPIAKMQEFTDKMCACKDKACVEAVGKEMEEWGKTQDKGAEGNLSDDQKKKAEEIAKKMGECMTKHMTAE
jgi:hypothetical protein